MKVLTAEQVAAIRATNETDMDNVLEGLNALCDGHEALRKCYEACKVLREAWLNRDTAKLTDRVVEAGRMIDEAIAGVEDA
jgi:hypothetical protein